MALPTLTETLDDKFTNTWYEIRAEGIDNILDAIPITAIFRRLGRFKTQVGARFIERTIRYGKKTAFAFKEGDTYPVTQPGLRTAALWDWAYIGVPVTRTFVEDQKNSGPEKINDYVKDGIMAAREALIEKIEDVLMAEKMVAADANNKDPSDHLPLLPF